VEEKIGKNAFGQECSLKTAQLCFQKLICENVFCKNLPKTLTTILGLRKKNKEKFYQQ
jgi:hypothetical protein